MFELFLVPLTSFSVKYDISVLVLLQSRKKWNIIQIGIMLEGCAISLVVDYVDTLYYYSTYLTTQVRLVFADDICMNYEMESKKLFYIAIAIDVPLMFHSGNVFICFLVLD